jgi:ArsR family transcriptional regulator, arsenate/arsenite/antimonite-responsive transcriptional repressor
MGLDSTSETTMATERPCCQMPISGGAGQRHAALAAADGEWLTRVAKALGDPIRLKMLDAMAQGRACCGLPNPKDRGVPGLAEPLGICVCDFQEHFGLSQSKVSYHLRILREAGLVSEEPRGKWAFYRVDRQAASQALEVFRSLLLA